eukprot:3346669-Rhodomonas_salina.2
MHVPEKCTRKPRSVAVLPHDPNGGDFAAQTKYLQRQKGPAFPRRGRCSALRDAGVKGSASHPYGERPTVTPNIKRSNVLGLSIRRPPKAETQSTAGAA